jgi:hypothetical protein
VAGPKIVPYSLGVYAAPELRHVALPPNVHPARATPRDGRLGQRSPDQDAARPTERPRPAQAAPPAGHALPARRAPGARPETFLHSGPTASQRSSEVTRFGGNTAPGARHQSEAGSSETDRPTAEPAARA